MENTEQSARKRGPVPGPKTERYQVLLDPDAADWGKRQPGGLSELLRKLLSDAYEKANSSPSG